MNAAYAYAPAIWLPLGVAVLLAAVGLYSWRRRRLPGALQLTIGCLFAALVAGGSVMEQAAVALPTKMPWFTLQSACRIPIIIAVTGFTLEYAWPGRWLTRRNILLLSIVPVLFLGLVLTNDLHHLVYRGFELDGSLRPRFGPAGWITVAYAFGVLGTLSILVFVWLFIRSPEHRWAAVIMLTGLITGRAAFVLDRLDIIPSPLPLNMLGMAFEFLTYAVALFGFRILDPLPAARQTALAQMRDGMLVCDARWQVVSLNPTAEAILGVSTRRARGRTCHELLAAFSGLPPLSPEAAGDAVEISQGTGATAPHYVLSRQPLVDFRDQTVGYLLLVRDVTEQRRAQAQLLEQQRTLATLQERERLARELHDGLGQVLAAAHLQASTAKLLLAEGDTVQVGECLDGLADAALQAQADVREYLLVAKGGFAPDLPLWPALQGYLQRFTRQYGLPVELSVPPELEGSGLPPSVEVQLLRIIQEALSNVRKHARARSAQVRFALSGPQLRVAIIDDGRGFDPAADSGGVEGGYGLRAMRDRAQALGGSLLVESTPGQGTRVEVQVPLPG